MALRTKKAIREGFLSLLNETPFDKITVLDIAGRSNINRNTFYYYYADIYALVDDVLQTETQRIKEMHITAQTWPEAYKQVTAFVRSNQRAVYNLFLSQNRDRLEGYLYDILLVGMESFVTQEAAPLRADAQDIHALAVFYTAALQGLAIQWMRNGMTEDVDAYIDHLGSLLDGNIRRALAGH